MTIEDMVKEIARLQVRIGSLREWQCQTCKHWSVPCPVYAPSGACGLREDGEIPEICNEWEARDE